MPGWAGSSVPPPHGLTNEARFVSEEAEQYQTWTYTWRAEHATGHLLYARFWYLLLKDSGLVSGK
jgi:leucyl-tRNA synthetase